MDWIYVFDSKHKTFQSSANILSAGSREDASVLYRVSALFLRITRKMAKVKTNVPAAPPIRAPRIRLSMFIFSHV